jgi:hypothetical protein
MNRLWLLVIVGGLLAWLLVAYVGFAALVPIELIRRFRRGA